MLRASVGSGIEMNGRLSGTRGRKSQAKSQQTCRDDQVFKLRRNSGQLGDRFEITTANFQALQTREFLWCTLPRFGGRADELGHERRR